MAHCDGGKVGRAAPDLTCEKTNNPFVTVAISHCASCEDGYRASNDDKSCDAEACRDLPDVDEHGAIIVKSENHIAHTQPPVFSGTKAKPGTVAIFGCDDGYVLLSAKPQGSGVTAPTDKPQALAPLGKSWKVTCDLTDTKPSFFGGKKNTMGNVCAPLCVKASDVCGRLGAGYCMNGGICTGAGDCDCAAAGASGVRCETKSADQDSSGGHAVVWVILILLVMGGAAGGGYVFWKKKQDNGGSSLLSEYLDRNLDAYAHRQSPPQHDSQGLSMRDCWWLQRGRSSAAKQQWADGRRVIPDATL